MPVQAPAISHFSRVRLKTPLARQQILTKIFVSQIRLKTNSSSERWLLRQRDDQFAKNARMQDWRSRAAYKLLEIDQRYSIFKPGQTVIDLIRYQGFAPGSWSQVAASRTGSAGLVIGIDILPVQPPPGVIFVQVGNRNIKTKHFGSPGKDHISNKISNVSTVLANESGDLCDGDTVRVDRTASKSACTAETETSIVEAYSETETVDVVLSDMLMNTSGNPFKDHIDSMELCNAALHFAYQCLKTGGGFVCKYYQGTEDKLLEQRMRCLFTKVYREKPASSRKVSREAYIVGLWRRANAPDPFGSDCSVKF